MNKWECAEPGCDLSVVGVGPAYGLRAIGWTFESGGQARCPQHRMDGIDAGAPERTSEYGFVCVVEGACGICAADRDVREYLYGGRPLLTDQERRKKHQEAVDAVVLRITERLLRAGHEEAEAVVLEMFRGRRS